MKVWCRVESPRPWALRELGPRLALGMGQILVKPTALIFIEHKERLERGKEKNRKKYIS
jgi:hypothetical protein